MQTKIFKNGGVHSTAERFTLNSSRFVFAGSPEYKSLSALTEVEKTAEVIFDANKESTNEAQKNNMLRAYAGGVLHMHREETDPAVKTALQAMDKALMDSFKSEVAATGKGKGSPEQVKAKADADTLLETTKAALVTISQSWLAKNPKPTVTPPATALTAAEKKHSDAWDDLSAKKTAYETAATAYVTTQDATTELALQTTSEALSVSLKKAEKVIAPAGGPKAAEINKENESRNSIQVDAENYLDKHGNDSKRTAEVAKIRADRKTRIEKENELNGHWGEEAKKDAAFNATGDLAKSVHDAVEKDVNEWKAAHPKTGAPAELAKDKAFDELEQAMTKYSKEISESGAGNPTGVPTAVGLDGVHKAYREVQAKMKATEVANPAPTLESVDKRNERGKKAKKWLDTPDTTPANTTTVRPALQQAYNDWRTAESKVGDSNYAKEVIDKSTKLQAAFDAAEGVEKH